MAAAVKLQAFIRHVSQGLAAQGLAHLSDQQLLERFLGDNGEAAFEALVRRHGPMVLHVCRRTLHQTDDAEDAFQATFLLLARQARSIRKPQSLASWLHGVAHRVALKARARRTVRQRHEKLAAVTRGKDAGQVTWDEVRSALDEELNRLPEKWRLPLILCYLEEKTQDEAAGQLGWSKNTIRRRLEEGREALGRRFARRGLTLSAGLCGSLLCVCTAEAGPSVNLVAATVAAAVQLAAGKTAAGIVPAGVITLVEGVLKSMFTGKVKLAAAIILLSFGLMAGGWGWLARSLAGDESPSFSYPTDKPVKLAREVPDRRVDPKEKTLPPGSILGRLQPHRDIYLQKGGGTRESEAAVVRGLDWLVRHQEPNGCWKLEGKFNDKGVPNDVGGTALGLLPFLGRGHSHKAGKDNPYAAVVMKGLRFLMSKQNQKIGELRGGMYAHGLGTIALAEAYGLTRDPLLKGPAQKAVNYLIKAQHQAGGWRYSPGQPGDTSVTSWQVTALKTAQMAGLVVPPMAFAKAQAFLAGCRDISEGYGYIGPTPTPSMTAAALLCRQNLQSWGPKNPQLVKGVANYLKTNPPGAIRNIYYYFYATQVMHHLGGDDWKAWDEKMRPLLLAAQDKDGSWSSAGDAFGGAGGRVFMTSLSLLTLEVYYRHVPIAGN